MAGPSGAVEIGAVPFAEAIDFFRRKGNLRLPTAHWTDISDGMHSRAFVVAGAQSDAQLADFHGELARLQAGGGILADFRKSFDAIVARHGWRHRLSAGFRSRVIFQTNMRTAAAAGRWAQIQRLKDRRPYIRYVAVMDARTRPLHAEWHGTVLHADDPWWDTHFPPCGWNCRCTVQSLSERDLQRFGYEVSPRAPRSLLVPQVVRTPDGPIVVPTPEGIDPGFAYNPGKAAGAGEQLLAHERHGRWEDIGAPFGRPWPDLPHLKLMPPSAPLFARATSPGELPEMMARALGARERVLTDPTGERVIIGAALPDHLAEAQHRQGRERYFPLIPALVETAAEIWISFARSSDTGRVWVRRRYLKAFDIGKGRALVLVTDFDGRVYSGLTLFQTELRQVRAPAKLRSGHRLYFDPEQMDLDPPP